ncbi:glutathione synthase/RimK-type ligase-like ATP-grasp enzyme [Nocardia pseudobrasiliensis]|uniref:Glutathione synthase/RimK-type ligase-like ATP-grasp enzyme n=1 Tax=Nocardia pseudobrasiliensis TaxID=45979 RepID=A0A370ICE9_9NOCA|nr:glutathione synthase/RimK-type ligase-like ATP-grasp enzyme [Nocardia pseudobrasiliensis]
MPHSCSPRVALVTCTEYPALLPEDAGILPLLHSRGIDAQFAVWTDPSIDWASFDVVVAIGVWGYYKQHHRFLQWLSDMERNRIPLWNSPSLIRWNSDKRYLCDLATRGVRIVPTVVVEAGLSVRLTEVLTAYEWDFAVIKPALSACAYRTFRAERATADTHQAELDVILESSSALIQPFFPEIRTAGEWTFCYYDGVLSHTLLKMPAAQDYRVQRRYGGIAELRQAPPWLLEQAHSVLDALPEQPAYARIDGVCRARDFYLMEAELIEPSWFFELDPYAMIRYADLLETLIHRSPAPTTARQPETSANQPRSGTR